MRQVPVDVWEQFVVPAFVEADRLLQEWREGRLADHDLGEHGVPGVDPSVCRLLVDHDFESGMHDSFLRVRVFFPRSGLSVFRGPSDRFRAFRVSPFGVPEEVGWENLSV